MSRNEVKMNLISNKIKESDAIAQVKSEIIDSVVDGIIDSVKRVQRETHHNLMRIALNDEKLYKILVELYIDILRVNISL